MAAGTQLDPLPTVEQPKSFSSKRGRWTEIVFVIAACTYVPYLSSLFVILNGGVAPGSNFSQRLVLQISFELVSLALLIYVLARRGEPLSQIGWQPRWSDLWQGLVLSVAATLASGVARIFYFEFYKLFFGAAPTLRDLSSLLPMKFSLLMTIFVLVNSFYEEGVTRGFLMTELQEMTGSKWLTIGSSVLLQTGYHAYQGLGNMISVGGVFLVSSLYFARNRRLVPVILSHTLLNLYSMVWASR